MKQDSILKHDADALNQIIYKEYVAVLIWLYIGWKTSCPANHKLCGPFQVQTLTILPTAYSRQWLKAPLLWADVDRICTTFIFRYDRNVMHHVHFQQVLSFLYICNIMVKSCNQLPPWSYRHHADLFDNSLGHLYSGQNLFPAKCNKLYITFKMPESKIGFHFSVPSNDFSPCGSRWNSRSCR